MAPPGKASVFEAGAYGSCQPLLLAYLSDRVFAEYRHLLLLSRVAFQTNWCSLAIIS